MQDTRRADTPGVAEDRVLLAVQVGEVGRVRSGGKEGDTAIEGFLSGLAQAKACCVGACDEDHPLLDTRRRGRGARLNELLVVGKRQMRHLHVGDLRSGGIDWVGNRLDRRRGGDGRGGGLGSLSEPALDLAEHVVDERDLLRGRESRQGDEHGGCAHGCGVVYMCGGMCRRDCGGGGVDGLLTGGTTGARVEMTAPCSKAWVKELYYRSVKLAAVPKFISAGLTVMKTRRVKIKQGLDGMHVGCVKREGMG